MVRAAGVISCLVSSWMMSHLGRKPVNGGKPARDNRVSIRVTLSRGVFVHDVINVDNFVVLDELRERKMVEVKRVYRMKFRMVSLGE